MRLFLRELGRRLRHPVRFYLVGGSVMIDLGLRPATLDVDYVAEADGAAALAELEGAIRILKNELDINVEPVSPRDFLPVPASALARSRYVGQFGALTVFYFHLPSLAIAKVARGLEQDFADVGRLVRAGEVAWEEVEATWSEMRSSPTGWLRYEPEDVERRLRLVGERIRAGQ